MKKLSILLIEDDYVDIESVRRSLKKLKIAHELFVAHNGIDGLSMLTGASGTEKIEPDIILLDVNMPKMNGIEFLRIVRSYYSLAPIKIFILSTSGEECDKIATENLGVDGYILKPLDFNKTKSLAIQNLLNAIAQKQV